jgi:hypothetical protein
MSSLQFIEDTWYGGIFMLLSGSVLMAPVNSSKRPFHQIKHVVDNVDTEADFSCSKNYNMIIGSASPLL